MSWSGDHLPVLGEGLSGPFLVALVLGILFRLMRKSLKSLRHVSQAFQNASRGFGGNLHALEVGSLVFANCAFFLFSESTT